MTASMRSDQRDKAKVTLARMETKLPASQVLAAAKAVVRAPPTEHIPERQSGGWGA